MESIVNISILTILKEYFYFCIGKFTIISYISNSKNGAVFLWGTISRIFVYIIVILDFYWNHYITGSVLLLEAIFLTLLNFSNFTSCYLRNYFIKQIKQEMEKIINEEI